MEIALNGGASARSRLAEGGWRLVDPRVVARDPWTYQRYIENSRAEFCVARHAYVSTRCGWFSDRSTAYLAMGRPVVVQDTGFTDFLPGSAGLLAYRSPEEARGAIARVRADYESHAPGRAGRRGRVLRRGPGVSATCWTRVARATELGAWPFARCGWWSWA